MNNTENENGEKESRRRKKLEEGRGKGAKVYIGGELIDVLERWLELSDYSTMRKASDELGKTLKKYNLILQQPVGVSQEQREEKKENEDGFAGFMGFD